MRIEYGYDRQAKSWHTVVIDREGKIIESDYSGDLGGAKWAINHFKEQYNITEVKKIKAY
jgi:hypothetical protein